MYARGRNGTKTLLLISVFGAAAAGLTYAATNSSADSEAATSLRPYAERVGAGVAADPSSDALQRLAALQRGHGVKLSLTAARTTDAPASAGSGAKPWTIAPTVGGGVCVATDRLVFCGLDEREVAAGLASGTEYPADTLVSFDREAGRAVTKPSTDSGVRTGVAPPESSEVVVTDKSGREIRSIPVDRGLYQVDVPAQGAGSRLEFRDAQSRVLAQRPVEG